MKITFDERGMTCLRGTVREIVNRFMDINMFLCTMTMDIENSTTLRSLFTPRIEFTFHLPIVGDVHRAMIVSGDVLPCYNMNVSHHLVECHCVSMYAINALIENIDCHSSICFHIEADEDRHNNRLYLSVNDSNDRMPASCLDLQKAYFREAEQNFWRQIE